jgi:hypothetical protein
LITDEELKAIELFKLGLSMFSKLSCELGEYVSILRSHGLSDEQVRELVIQYLQVRANR